MLKLLGSLSLHRPIHGKLATECMHANTEERPIAKQVESVELAQLAVHESSDELPSSWKFIDSALPVMIMPPRHVDDNVGMRL